MDGVETLVMGADNSLRTLACKFLRFEAEADLPRIPC